MDEDRPTQPAFAPLQDDAFPRDDSLAASRPDAYEPGMSRKLLFGMLGGIAVVFAFGSAWVGYQYASTSAIDRLGKSVPATPTARAVTPAPAPVTPPGAPPVTPSITAVTEPGGPSAPPSLPSAQELLADKKVAQPASPAPEALTRDLPDWLATEVGGRTGERPRKTPPALQTSGVSADESAHKSEDKREPARTTRAQHAERQERAAAVFARCPKPGESGAVECRRAVCSGAARKQGACAAYVN